MLQTSYIIAKIYMLSYENPPKPRATLFYTLPLVVQLARSSQVRTGTHYGPSLYMTLSWC